jgi:hypothetical protein
MHQHYAAMLRSPFLGAICGLATMTPALAADFEVALPAVRLSERDLLLIGSLVVLSVALALRIHRRRHSVEPLADSPDLRWWKNP